MKAKLAIGITVTQSTILFLFLLYFLIYFIIIRGTNKEEDLLMFMRRPLACVNEAKLFRAKKSFSLIFLFC
jgi:hypothetical protein